MNATARRLLNTFLTGLLAALPLAATALIIAWAVQLLYGWFGPGSLFGRVMIAIGVGVTGFEVVGYLIGVGLVGLAIFGLGLVVRTRLRRVIADVVNAVMQNIPLVRNVYDLVKKFVDLLAQRDAQGLHSMSPVWLHFGGAGGAAVLGLLSTPESVMVGGRPYLAVLVPTAPVPVGGGLIYVPCDWVTPAEIGVEGLTSIYVSMGITSRQHLEAGRPAGDPAPTAATPSA
ncbi:DUF502 domain-containing protein [Piscinibacter sp.]|uniref:DUF502 domain-containing protein n=1 Tax=Piscinibacter sp. TaxID=1903157 RepID=UPI002C8C6095|nr:DUF502 domain-containing protein [Albitalea sp.]HUG25723.1 DUF502 domain-containing protein [Albitalea sp.]